MDRLRTTFREYLRNLPAAIAQRINPQIVARDLGASVAEAVAVLEAEVRAGVLRRRYWITCPIKDAGIRWFEEGDDLPDSLECDLCEEGPHPVDPERIEVRYAPATQGQFVQR